MPPAQARAALHGSSSRTIRRRRSSGWCTVRRGAKFVKSAGNIAGVKTTFAGSVNTYDVLNADKLIISVDAAKKLEEVLG